MKIITFNLLFILSCLVGTANAADSFPIGKVIDTVTNKTDPTQSYALYIPAKGKTAALPVIYCFDPHGAGALPLNKYKALAETYGFILIGSNNSKNGNDWSTTTNIWHHLYDDTKGRLKIDVNRIYTCGFSGGAKVAGYIALQFPGIKGVIAGGAGLPDGVPAGDFDFSLTAIAGEGDMNRTDLVAISKELDGTRTRHHLIHFDGIHEWAPERTMSIAFAGLQLDAMTKGLAPKDAAFINQYIARSKVRLDGFSKTNQLIRAQEECQLTISYLDGLSKETDWFTQKMTAIAGNPAYQKQRVTEEDLLAREQNTKTEYMQHFQQDDRTYWASVIREQQTKAKLKGPEAGMHQRLLAYLSLAFYSISNQLINNNRNIEAWRFVELYKMADPTNSEAWYFSAILCARDHQTPATKNNLITAVKYGFRDMVRLRQQPEFQNLRINFAGIEGLMR